MFLSQQCIVKEKKTLVNFFHARSIINITVITLCYLFISTFALTARADLAAGNELAQSLKLFSSFQAKFKQKTIDETGLLIEEYSGDVFVKRPGKLYWQSEAPFSQILVSDNKKIWFYDVDLKQVTERDASDSLSQAPALILSGDAVSLKKNFIVSKLATTDQKQTAPSLNNNKIASHTQQETKFLLKPINNTSLFEDLSLTLKDGKLSQLVIRDGLQQQTIIDLLEFKSNVAISDKRFTFKVPKGVKVIRDAQAN